MSYHLAGYCLPKSTKTVVVRRVIVPRCSDPLWAACIDGGLYPIPGSADLGTADVVRLMHQEYPHAHCSIYAEDAK
jgi:hypothetical protein